jgi:hypothetical protein
MKIKSSSSGALKKKRDQTHGAAPLDRARGVFRDRTNRSGLTARAGCDSRFARACAITIVREFPLSSEPAHEPKWRRALQAGNGPYGRADALPRTLTDPCADERPNVATAKKVLAPGSNAPMTMSAKSRLNRVIFSRLKIRQFINLVRLKFNYSRHRTSNLFLFL